MIVVFILRTEANDTIKNVEPIYRKMPFNIGVMDSEDRTKIINTLKKLEQEFLFL